jgi:DNA-binding transcriptional LysR family regulator
MFEELRTFVIFAEEGAIQKVARRLPLTQPAVSRQIQRLEQVLGTKLLDRRQKPPILTPMGCEVVARSREILDAFENLKSIAAIPEPEGVFRFGLVNGLAHEDLAESVAAVMGQFPRVSLRLKSGWSGELAEQHRLGHLDAAVILSDGSRFYDAEKIGEEEVISIASSDFGSRGKEQIGWVLSPEGCDVRNRLTRRLAKMNLPLVVSAEIEHAGLQLGMVRQGMGLGLMPKRLISRNPPVGIEEIDVIGGSLHFDVLMLRSPHIGPLAKVAEALVVEIRTFLSGLGVLAP